MIKDLQNSSYVSIGHHDSFCRTVLNLIVIDRLRHLEDRGAHHRPLISADVPVTHLIKDDSGHDKIVKGRADLALGYGTNKNNTGAILSVVEAKPFEPTPVGMPQLLVCMAAVHEAREGRKIRSVFGMISSGREFRFGFLNEEKKFSQSKRLTWKEGQATIIAYVDMMLLKAIESSQHMTPQDINIYPNLDNEEKWSFGAEDDSEAEDKDEEDVVADTGIAARLKKSIALFR